MEMGWDLQEGRHEAGCDPWIQYIVEIEDGVMGKIVDNVYPCHCGG
jgi:hypothetical protein